jgi:rhodanese-related sulfurtransferase
VRRRRRAPHLPPALLVRRGGDVALGPRRAARRMSGERSLVTATPAADPAIAAEHFASRLCFETDCADVHADLTAGEPAVVVLDARSRDAYAAGHVPGAHSLPHREISVASTADLPRDAVLVTYCWGPHCNAATRAAAALAALGFRVKEMVGGISGWQAEGYDLRADPRPGQPEDTDASPRPTAVGIA